MPFLTTVKVIKEAMFAVCARIARNNVLIVKDAEIKFYSDWEKAELGYQIVIGATDSTRVHRLSARGSNV